MRPKLSTSMMLVWSIYDQKLISAINVVKNSMLPVVAPVAPTDFRNQITLPQLPLPQYGHLEGENHR